MIKMSSRDMEQKEKADLVEIFPSQLNDPKQSSTLQPLLFCIPSAVSLDLNSQMGPSP